MQICLCFITYFWSLCLNISCSNLSSSETDSGAEWSSGCHNKMDRAQRGACKIEEANVKMVVVVWVEINFLIFNSSSSRIQIQKIVVCVLSFVLQIQNKDAQLSNEKMKSQSCSKNFKMFFWTLKKLIKHIIFWTSLLCLVCWPKKLWEPGRWLIDIPLSMEYVWMIT